MKIGRVDDLEVTMFDEAGDMLALQVYFTGSGVESAAVRQQVLGHVGETVPVIVDDDCTPLNDGFYTILSASSAGNYNDYAADVVRFSLTLQRVANGYAAPAIEVLADVAVRASGVVPPDGETDYVPIGSYIYDDDGGDADDAEVAIFIPNEASVAGGYASGFPTATGSVKSAADATLATGETGQLSTLMTVAPEHYYAGSVLIEVKGSDDAWRAVTGRQMPFATPAGVRISNGLVRAGWTSGGDLLLVEIWRSSAWEEVDTFSFSDTIGGNYVLDPEAAPSVLRNSPASGTLSFRYAQDGPTVNLSPFYDVTVRRGERQVTVMPRAQIGERLRMGTLSSTTPTLSAEGYFHVSSVDPAWSLSGSGAQVVASDAAHFAYPGPAAPIVISVADASTSVGLNLAAYGIVSVSERFVS